MKFPGLMIAAALVLLGAGAVQAACADLPTQHACGGAPGTDGDDVTMDVPSGATGSYTVQSAGGAGTGDGSAGDGGAVDVTVKDGTTLSSFAHVQSLGGETSGDGDAGWGNEVTFTLEAGGSVNSLSASSNGGAAAGEGSPGDGGPVSATIAGNVTTTATISSTGGEAGELSTGAGNGGAVTVVVTSTGQVGTLFVTSMGSEEADDTKVGDAGKIDVAIAGEIGSMLVTSSGVNEKTVSVVLEDGAVVTGSIAVAGNNKATLTFDMQMTSRREYNAALAVLLDPTKPAGGEIIVNGRSYAWTGFDQLVNMLDYVGETQPTAPVQVTVTRPGINKAPAAASFSCDKVAVHAVVQPDGTIALYANAGGAKGKSLIGVVKDGRFRSSGLDFSVVVTDGTYTVKNAAGSVVSTCK